MDFIKKHKLLVSFITIFLIIIVISFILLKQFFVDTSKDEYGNRLDGIEDVAITENDISKFEKEVSGLNEIEKATYRVQGRLIYISISFNEDVAIDTAQQIATNTLDYFDSEKKEYYDIQITITNKNKDAENYPKMGYKHKTSESIVW